MSNRLLAPLALFVVAALIHLYARAHFGSFIHQAFLTVLTFTLVADGIWLLGKRVAAGETPLPALPAYLWVARIVAIATLVVGILSGAHKAGFPLPGHF